MAQIALFDVSLSAFVIVDLIAATTNAFNGALLARRPNHYRNYTIVGIILIAVIGGIAGGVARDVLLNYVPSAFENPYYIILSVVAALLALFAISRAEKKFLNRLFKFMAAFSLPWYAAVGVNRALTTPDVTVVAAIVIGVIAPTAGRFMIDIISKVTPKQFIKGEWFVGTAILASVVYVICYFAGLSLVPATLISFAVGFSFRITALQLKWEEPEPSD